MTTGELIEKLSKYPANAEILMVLEGDRSVGIPEQAWPLTGDVVSDEHKFQSDESQWDSCVECGFIRSAHESAPVTVYLRGEE